MAEYGESKRQNKENTMTRENLIEKKNQCYKWRKKNEKKLITWRKWEEQLEISNVRKINKKPSKSI